MKKIRLAAASIVLAVLLVAVNAHFLAKSYKESFATFPRCEESALKKVVIDTDAGADDAIAILLVLQAERNSSHEFKTIAITCTYGNTELGNVEQNVLKTLTIANRSDIPVFGGVDRPLIHKYEPSTYFGEDGFGDFLFTQPILGKVNRSLHAAVALVELSKEFPGEITLLAIGPQTNLALAQRLDPGFLSRLKNLVVLGGSVAGIGNMSPNVEFNFYQDPEANWITFNSTDKPLWLVPWEAVLQADITKEWRTNQLHKVNSTITRFLDKAERISLKGNALWKPSDAVAAAIMIWPDLVLKNLTTNVTPVVDGAARASILVDYAETSGKQHNTVIVQDVNSTEFLALLLTLFS